MGIGYDTILVFNTAVNHVKTCRKLSTKLNSIYDTKHCRKRIIVFKSLLHFKILKKTVHLVTEIISEIIHFLQYFYIEICYI